MRCSARRGCAATGAPSCTAKMGSPGKRVRRDAECPGAAVSKLMRNRDLIAVARKRSVVTRFRNTLGLPGRLAVRLQPNHPTDDLRGISASIVDGLLMGCGDAMIGVNPASDNIETARALLILLDEIRERYAIPTQTCVLTHVTNALELIGAGAPVDLTFQSIAGTEAANRGSGIHLAILREAHEATLSLRRNPLGNTVMYFETGQIRRCRRRRSTASTSSLSRPARRRSRGRSSRSRRQRRRLRWAGISVRWQADHPRRARGSLLRQAARPADGGRRLLHQSRRRRSGRHG